MSCAFFLENIDMVYSRFPSPSRIRTNEQKNLVTAKLMKKVKKAEKLASVIRKRSHFEKGYCVRDDCECEGEKNLRTREEDYKENIRKFEEFMKYIYRGYIIDDLRDSLENAIYNGESGNYWRRQILFYESQQTLFESQTQKG